MLYRGIELFSRPMELSMGFQCSNGGLRLDTNAMTTIPGVFACGEAATGMHGADRIGGKMLAACLVFGIQAAKNAMVWAQKHSNPPKNSTGLPTLIEKLKAMCAADVIVVDISDASLELARKIGADKTVKADGNEVEAVLALTGGNGAEAVIDFVGEKGTTAKGLKMTRPARR